MSINLEAYKFCFLNYDLGLKHTGIESSALLRARLFDYQLKIPVTILTYKYRSHLATEVSLLKQKRKLPKSTVVLSLYDYLQQFRECRAPNVYVGMNNQKIPFKNTDNVRYVNDEGQLEAFVIYNKLNSRLHYINYFESGIKRRRDYYHESGHLSCTQILSSKFLDRIEQEIFYRYDQKICLIKEHQYNEFNKRILTKYQVFNDDGCFQGFLSNDSDFLSYVLDQYVNNKRCNIYEDINYLDNKHLQYVLLIDKNKFFYDPAIKLKDLFDHVKVITTIHNLHVIINDKKKTSHINSNYTNLFKNLEAPDAIIVQTNIQKKEILDEFGDSENVYSIPHSYDFNDTDTVFDERDLTKAVYFARYDIDKKHELAIEAFIDVVEAIPDAQFHCFGVGHRLNELQNLVKDLGMTRNIFLHDWCDNVVAEYESSALSIISSPSESFSLTIAESLLHGCPVVAFDVPYGPRELILSDENGYLVPYEDTKMMADKIIQIMKNPELQKRLSLNARKSAARYSEKEVSTKWLEVFQNILKE